MVGSFAKFTACGGVIDTQQEVSSEVWFRTRPQHGGLDVVELDGHDLTR